MTNLGRCLIFEYTTFRPALLGVAVFLVLGRKLSFFVDMYGWAALRLVR